MTGPEDSEASRAPREERVRRRVISNEWGVSIAVVIALLGFGWSVVKDGAEDDTTTNSRLARIESKLETLDKLESLMQEFSGQWRVELLTIQRENASLRERFATDIGDLRVQLAELRAKVDRNG